MSETLSFEQNATTTIKFDAPKSIKGWRCLRTVLVKLFPWAFSKQSLFTPAKIGKLKHTTHEGELGQEKILSISRLGIVEKLLNVFL